MQRAFLIIKTPLALVVSMVLGAKLLTGCASTSAPRPACPTAQQMEQPELLGLWRVQMDGEPGPITIELGRHPEWDGTVKGTIRRPGYSSIVVGDVNKGELTMEESRDGKSVSGNWYGAVVERSCAREIRGEWASSDDRIVPFIMRKSARP